MRKKVTLTCDLSQVRIYNKSKMLSRRECLLLGHKSFLVCVSGDYQCGWARRISFEIRNYKSHVGKVGHFAPNQIPQREGRPQESRSPSHLIPNEFVKLPVPRLSRVDHDRCYLLRGG